MEDEQGFTLIELTLVVTMVGILASIAMPSVSKARAFAVETSTIGSLKALSGAQAIYASACGTGFFAPTVATLRVPGSGKAAFIGPEFASNSVKREGYTISFSAGTVAAKAPKTCNGVAAGKSLQTYFIGADPVTAGPAMGTRHFGMNQTGAVYQSSKRIKAFYTGAPPSPAKIIQ